MKKCLLFVILLVSVIFFCEAASAGVTNPHKLTIQEKRFDFLQLIHQIKNQYGPKQYKKTHFGIDVDQLSDKYWPMMKEAKTNGEFYSLIIKFVAEFKDGHFSAWIPSSYGAWLPFVCNLVENKVVIESVERNNISVEEFPFDRGDEVVAIDGVKVSKLLDELETYLSSGNPRATRNKAAYFLTGRPGRIMPVPSGKTAISIRPYGENKTITITMEWENRGNPFDENIVSATDVMKEIVIPEWIAKDDNVETTYPLDLSIFDIVEGFARDTEDSYHCNGGTRIDIPEDATIIIEDPFVAYYYPTPMGNVGYLRIPHYSPKDKNNDGEKDTVEWLGYYTWALTILEANTVGLIIDQDHNCGGSIFFMEDMVSLFMSNEFRPLTFQFRASKFQIIDFSNWLNWYEGNNLVNTLEYDGVLEMYYIVKESFNKGLFLTPKTTLRGSQLIKPRNIYTKPVLILVDYFAGSGGDAFPSMMQGNGRAKLLGTATWGLGGHVIKMEPLFYSQIGTRMTQSLFFRPDGTPVENIGAIPDIHYEITMSDFMHGYRDYQTFYTDELLKLISLQE